MWTIKTFPGGGMTPFCDGTAEFNHCVQLMKSLDKFINYTSAIKGTATYGHLLHREVRGGLLIR